MRPKRSVDFRSHRTRLPSSAFVFPGTDVAPTDPISQKTWSSLTSLPDDVSIITTDHYGSLFESTWELWGEWSCLVGALQVATDPPASSPIAHVACDATDYFQGSIYNALVGFYRLAFASLRAVLDCMTIGLYHQASSDDPTYRTWLEGEEIRFGTAADSCHNLPLVRSLQGKLRDACNDDLFRPRDGRTGDPGGLARRLHRHLSGYAHGSPGHTDSDSWQSNGPVFASDMLKDWNVTFRKTFSLAVLEACLAEPSLEALEFGSTLTARDVFARAMDQIPQGSDGYGLLASVPDAVWPGQSSSAQTD